MNRQIVSIDGLGSNEELRVIKQKRDRLISHVRIGDGKGSRYFDSERKKMNLQKVEYKDAVQELIDMNEAEGFFFKKLVDLATTYDIDEEMYVTTAIVHLDTKGFTPSEKNKLSRGFKSLEKKNIVKRIKRGGHYCINPTMIVVDKFNKEYDYYMSL